MGLLSRPLARPGRRRRAQFRGLGFRAQEGDECGRAARIRMRGGGCRVEAEPVFSANTRSKYPINPKPYTLNPNSMLVLAKWEGKKP